MSLPLPWVDRIFDKLTLAYGRNFLGQWEGMDLNNVKSDWCHELSSYQRMPEAIAFALQNLPDRPINVIEFRKIAKAAPLPDVPRIEAVRANPARIAAELGKLAPLRVDHATGKRSDTAWAERLKAKDEANPRSVTSTVRTMYRAALGIRAPSVEAA